ncbi:MAG: hypothetical protein LBB09_01280 [Rickettsiales bacterium]|nr:hypothetical protein [Rickettsiales bacterium]
MKKEEEELKKLNQWKLEQQELNKKLENKIKEKTSALSPTSIEENQLDKTRSPIDANYDFGANEF